MSSRARFRVVSVIAFTHIVRIVTARSAAAAQSQAPQQSRSAAADSQAQAELGRALADILDEASPHMRMGPTRPATPADSARAAAFVRAARAALNQYVDVKLAERDGYYRNMPRLENQPIYHYNSLLNISATGRGEFDPTKPVSLLYKKDDRGQLKLVGAMYATGASAAPEALDALLPISMAHWHEHVNICNPGGRIVRNLPGTVGAATVFVVQLFFSITSASECEAAGGRFEPGGGWMAHVYMFAGDDPKLIWDPDDVGNMVHHMREPPREQRP
jgi:hypothetical protein